MIITKIIIISFFKLKLLFFLFFEKIYILRSLFRFML